MGLSPALTVRRRPRLSAAVVRRCHAVRHSLTCGSAFGGRWLRGGLLTVVLRESLGNAVAAIGAAWCSKHGQVEVQRLQDCVIGAVTRTWLSLVVAAVVSEVTTGRRHDDTPISVGPACTRPAVDHRSTTAVGGGGGRAHLGAHPFWLAPHVFQVCWCRGSRCTRPFACAHARLVARPWRAPGLP